MRAIREQTRRLTLEELTTPLEAHALINNDAVIDILTKYDFVFQGYATLDNGTQAEIHRAPGLICYVAHKLPKTPDFQVMENDPIWVVMVLRYQAPVPPNLQPRARNIRMH